MMNVRFAPAWAAIVLTLGCSAGDSPTAPTAVGKSQSANTDRLAAIAAADPAGPAMVRALSAVFDAASASPAAVNFPPRNEPAAFRAALEDKYRDSLRRSPVSTYVDQEGTVVWTQEYLRYRVGLCSHADAVSKVMAQIDGRGIGTECGTTSTATFPPRNEPLAFMVELEVKYRDGIRRPAVSSYVDVEGNVIWTQEYLRYRVSGCTHATAQQKVFDQIDGRGVQADCTPVVVVPTPAPAPSPSPSPTPSTCTSSNPPFTWDNNVMRCRNRLGQFAQSVCCGR